MTFFRPGRGERRPEQRQALAQHYRDDFVNWLEDQPEHQAAVVERFNRLFRGWCHRASQDALEIARWNPQYPLYPYQNNRRAAAQREPRRRAVLPTWDLARRARQLWSRLARQQGWARRAVIGAGQRDLELGSPS